MMRRLVILATLIASALSQHTLHNGLETPQYSSMCLSLSEPMITHYFPDFRWDLRPLQLVDPRGYGSGKLHVVGTPPPQALAGSLISLSLASTVSPVNPGANAGGWEKMARFEAEEGRQSGRQGESGRQGGSQEGSESESESESQGGSERSQGGREGGREGSQEGSQVSGRTSDVEDARRLRRIWKTQENWVDEIYESRDPHHYHVGEKVIPSVYVADLQPAVFEELDRNIRNGRPADSALFYFEDLSPGSATKFHDLLTKKAEEEEYNIPPIYPILEEILRRQTNSLFHRASFLVSSNYYWLNVNVESFKKRAPFISQVIYGKIMFLNLVFSVTESANTSFNPLEFLGAFRAALKDQSTSSFSANYSNAIMEAEIWSNTPVNANFLNLLDQFEDHEYTLTGSEGTAFNYLHIPKQNASFLLRFILAWANDANSFPAQIGPIGVQASQFYQAGDLSHRALMFNPVYCAVNVMPPSKTMLMMSKLTLLSLGFLILAVTLGFYLIMSYIHYLIAITMPPGTIPRFIRVRVIPLSVYLLYVSTDSVHEHRE